MKYRVVTESRFCLYEGNNLKAGKKEAANFNGFIGERVYLYERGERKSVYRIGKNHGAWFNV